MRKTLPILMVMIAILYSCGQERKSTPVKVSKELEQPTTLVSAENQTLANVSEQKNVDTRYVYIDSNDQNLIIENSYPRGGLKYTGLLGEEYIYAVFWTRITNETDNPFELILEFPKGSYELPSSPNRIFKICIPNDTLTPEKESLVNYGLDLEKHLGYSIHKQVALKRTINSKGSTGFYVVTLFNQGVNGTLRTGLSIKEETLFYRINDIEIPGGKINLNLKLQK